MTFTSTRKIVCAACKEPNTGILILGPRHWDITMYGHLHNLREFELLPTNQWKQGFIDQFGEFLSRTEAMKVALKAEQVDRSRNGSAQELFSEGLY